MINGSLTSADSSIIRLTYLSDKGTMSLSGTTTIRQGSDSLNSLSIAAISSVVFVFLCALIVARRYVSQKHKALLLQLDDDKRNDSMHLVEIKIPCNMADKQTTVAVEHDDMMGASFGDSVSTSSGADFYEDTSEVIVLNELGEELWISLAENKQQEENASSSIMGTDATDQSSVHSQRFDAWLYSDDGTFV